MGTLVITGVEQDAVPDQVAELVTAAVACGGSVSVGLIGPGAAELAGRTGYAGVDRVIAVEPPSAEWDPDVSAAMASAVIDATSADLVLMPYAIRPSAFAGALAVRQGFGFAADIVDVRRDDNVVVVTKPVYGGKVLAELDLPAGRPALVLVRPNVFAPAQEGPAAEVETLTVDDVRRVRHVEYHRPESGQVDLRRAKVILAVGRGVGGEENVAPFAELAKLLGAELGASRPIVDAGWLPPEHQVGQTGVTVKPKVYIAFGISGALQHLAGMQASKTIVAVNTDGKAPVFNVADVGAVADIHQVADEMRSLLAAQGTS